MLKVVDIICPRLFSVSIGWISMSHHRIDTYQVVLCISFIRHDWPNFKGVVDLCCMCNVAGLFKKPNTIRWKVDGLFNKPKPMYASAIQLNHHWEHCKHNSSYMFCLTVFILPLMITYYMMMCIDEYMLFKLLSLVLLFCWEHIHIT